MALIPHTLWGLSLPEGANPQNGPASGGVFQIHPNYRSARPLDATLSKVDPGSDEFINEKYAEQIEAILTEWSDALRLSPRAPQGMAKWFAPDFSGSSFQPMESKVVRSGLGLEIRRNSFAANDSLSTDSFLRSLESTFEQFSAILTAEFQITYIDSIDGKVGAASGNSPELHTRVRYEIVGAVREFHREQRIGDWELTWERSASGNFKIKHWSVGDETQARSNSQVFADVTSAAFGSVDSYKAQMLHGIDYWRTVLDSACGIDIYGHNGVSFADIDNDGFDDLYVCQPAGLPNRLYRNLGDGTFEDVTASSGLGILENTACALFADFNNDGWQDVILVRANGPLLFMNEGGGKFRQKHDAFQFAHPPQGTFTGAAVADYDRDGWLDIYFSLYSYYQGTGQYRYPLPYHDAENGPPNFLMHNNHDGTFRDVTAESGLNQNNTRYSFCCAWNDFNRDGWPDLYVVNDFGRKNLYRNNADGTFTDIAQQAGVEDVGAGMSVAWLDYDKDGAEDLYVGNMWTAAGVRVSMQDNFKPTSPPAVRALYQKHAMGNSLFRNVAGKSGTFEDKTADSRAGLGRWAWSSDSFDFDHDGYPDLYIANGMVSGPSRRDLNSFFWRQVVSRSPDDARPSLEYEQGWNAINELIRSDGSWSGYERNVFYANNRDGTFSDVSGAVGMDFIEDGRSLALADIDHDGRLEILLKNRNAPQFRLLKNVLQELPPSISFRLRGTKSNRDAIGAAITVDTGSARQTRMLQAGSGFLSQHSKDVFFGLGNAGETVSASIRWPSGLVQEFHGLPVNHRIWLVEGAAPTRMEAFKSDNKTYSGHDGNQQLEVLPTRIETWLLAPVQAPDFSLPDLSGETKTLSGMRGRPVLLCLWTAQLQDYRRELRLLQKVGLTEKGLQFVAIHIGPWDDSLRNILAKEHFSFPILLGSDDVAAVYNILYRQLFDRHRDLSLPISFLINSQGEIVKVYQGGIESDHLADDIQHIPQTDDDLLARSLPFPVKGSSLEFGRNYLSFGALYFQRGYLDQAGSAFEQAYRDDPSSAEALYGIGSVYLNQNKNDAAKAAFEKAVRLQASYPDTLPDAWNNLGVIATRQGQVEESVRLFQEALRLSPDHLLSLNNLGNAYRQLKKWDDARNVLDHALQVSPENPEANYSLGMIFAQTGDNEQAYTHLQKALKARPDYPEALNNLGVLYIMTKRPEQAIATLKQCIQVAPGFDQAYLNLARLYALEGERDKARELLGDLLKQHPDHPQGKELLDQLQH